MVVQYNMLAWNANRQYKVNTGKAKKVTEKLSSGYKINRAADDAAGLAMSEKMRRQIRGLSMSAENIQEGIGYVQTADGALNEAHDILHRMNELAVKSANGTLTEQDREYIDGEVQQLKFELDRIFSTTTFNEERIWDPDDMQKTAIDTEPKQAVTIKGNGNSTRFDTTNENCDALAVDRYNVKADAGGVSVSWTGYDGNAYETEKIDWDTFESNNYRFNVSDYFGDASDGVNDNLYDANGNPVFDFQIALFVQETATVDDIIACINGTYLSQTEYSGISGRFENSAGNGVTRDVTVVSEYLRYEAAYASNANGTEKNADLDGDGTPDDIYGHDFNKADDIFIDAADNDGNRLSGNGGTNLIECPSATTVVDARNSTEKWTFSFAVDGIGTVKATSHSIMYGANDRTEDDEGLWWSWVKPTNSPPFKSGISRQIGTGTLGDVMSVLTGDGTSDTPGLLNKNNASADGIGAADSGGYIYINFNLEADSDYSYGNGSTSNRVGSFSLQISVSAADTEQTVLDKITDALNGNTILDFYSTGGNSDYLYIRTPYANTHTIDVPVYGGRNGFYVQAGVESGQHINVQYDYLNVRTLGLKDTNVLTVEDSEKAIDEIKSALQDISRQRADFGAYQNRLEHAYAVNKNAEENTAASESVIRDTDMAAEMVKYSNQNILQQAGQAILAQANQTNASVLSLLN